tara:strand:- start:331 stop:852 length:522 start_codon:yes stop_codon:yes gene_type:complete
MGIKINIKFDDKRWLTINFKAMARKAFETTLTSLSRPELLVRTEISVLACNDRAIRKLNCKFRGIDAVTDILSWPKNNQLEDQVNRFYKCNRWDDDFKNEFGDLGDIAISYETCIKQSKELGVRLENHVVHLLVHACLHLLGFTHQENSDFQTMKELEIKCLKACGIENPYAL